MECHFGICIKESYWISGPKFNSIIVLAGDSNSNKLSFFVKIFAGNEDINENVKNIKFGTPVFFTSENENIISLHNVDCLFSLFEPQNITLKLEGLELSYNCYYGRLETRIEDYKRWPWSPFNVLINDLEKELMNSLYNKRLYEHFISSIPQITAKNLQNIIQEEEKEIEKYDIEDLIKELKISYHAACFCTRTDKPESYRISITHSFKDTKYANNKFDLYLKQILKLGSRIMEENDGWIDAEEQSKEVIDSENRYIPYLKMKMKNSYSKSEHLDYRVRDRMSQFIYPLFTMLRISGKVLHLEKDPSVDSIEGFAFGLSIDNKESILSDIRSKNSELKRETRDIIKDKIYGSFDQKKMLNEWLIPFPAAL